MGIYAAETMLGGLIVVVAEIGRELISLCVMK